ncbi:non-motor actin binding protein [Lithospermum erythrorhizon]|uniref:Non-motor actin binding protein n=1 Tax=Lithospermum erythrorhizon TaxID=34254 RepID=A0AAV3PAA4_LITER
MIIKLGLLFAASIAAYAIQQISVKRWRTLPKSSEMDEASKRQTSDEDNKNHFIHPTHGLKDVVQCDEEVKLISGIINQPSSNLSDKEDEISVFESLLSGEMDHPLPSDKFEKMKESKAVRDITYEKEMANNATEVERLRSLVQELQEREAKLEGELFEYYGLKKKESAIVELQKQSKIKSVEIDMLNMTIKSLQAERKRLQAEAAQGAIARKELEIAKKKILEMQRQIQLDANHTKSQLLLLKQKVISLQMKEEEAMKNDSEAEKKTKAIKELEVEVVELKRINKEVQHEKRELAVKLETAEAKIKTLPNMNSLRHVNENLQKQVEELQRNRFTEVEELVYIRWVNACLRYELGNYPKNEGKISASDLSRSLSPRSQAKAKQMMVEYAGSDSSEQSQGDTDLDRNVSQRSYSFSEYSDNVSIDSSLSKYSSLRKNSSLIQKLKKWGKSKDESTILSSPVRSTGGSSRRTRRGPLKALLLMDGGETVGANGFGMTDHDLIDSPESPRQPAETEKRAPRIPRSPGPPPKSFIAALTDSQSHTLKELTGAPHLPPPPPDGPSRPPPQAAVQAGGSSEEVHRASEAVEISNKSSFHIAVKADVETQGDFARFLATEVRAASFVNVDDLVAFVNWLDEELMHIDEQAVLKHLDWPANKADTLREASFGYQNLLNLEKQVNSFVDDPSLPWETALEKMYKLLEKVEQGVLPLLRTRDMAISRYKEFRIPVDWLLDSGLIGKIKLSSTKLARDYMKRVASELDSLDGPEKESNREFLALQGVRFGFRVHQFAGGFDAASMKAFEELRSQIGAQTREDKKQET